MNLKFVKMQGAGNDFVVIDAIRQTVELTPEIVRRLADRHFGVGCDQVLVVERPQDESADFRYRIFNADGAEVEQCGNGARCFVRFVRDQGLTEKSSIRVQTKAGLIVPRMEADGYVTVDMGVPRFEPAQVPFLNDQRALTYALDVAGTTLQVSVLSMGNPHAVQFVDDVAQAPVRSQGPLIEQHASFPARVNAGYAQILDREHIALRVWERGAGETLSCGTGACAAVVAGISRGLLDNRVEVRTAGGMLRIAWSGAGASVCLTGAAQRVFEGEINLSR